MTLQTFNFPYHRYETTNPEASTRVQFGNSYIFSARPSAPPQRTFKLFFETMRIYETNLGQIDYTTDPEMNFMRLVQFYQEHLTHKRFLYTHPLHGTLTVMFKSPLVEPKGIKGGFGHVEPFDVELIELP